MLVSVLGTYENGIVTLEEKPKGVTQAKVIVTIITDKFDDETRAAMNLSEASFSEWNNEADDIYDSL
jgi:hypothetical protein